MDNKNRVKVPEQSPEERAKNFKEVCLGYNEEQAKLEAERCLNCKVPQCRKGCPVSINIPGFINEIKNGDYKKAYEILSIDSNLPAICGRVCPQETQCEGKCVLGFKSEPIAIGKLERFASDYAREHDIDIDPKVEPNGIKIAVIGSGPAGLTCAGDLAKKGYDVTIFEALHKAGGVLTYGIPEFRLPKDTVVNSEIAKIKKLGVKFEYNVIVGKTVTIDQLLKEENFKAIFIGSGAGNPRFMGIPGEDLNNVFSANEFLTRANLMKASLDDFDTPISIGKKVAVIGGGNVAMDAARTALRLGAETTIVYRRSLEELPARREEVHHAQEEGIDFKILTNPTKIISDENGNVVGMTCIKMELGEPDASGRRRPIEVEGSEFDLDVDMVIMALGTTQIDVIAQTTPGLETNKWKCIVVNEETGQTSRKEIFAGGDVTSGASTVILAMEAGKKAAKGIDEYIKTLNK